MESYDEKLNLNNSLDKALKLINFFTQEKRVWGLSELSRESDIPKATVYRILSTFEENGYLTKISRGEDKDKYRLGFKFIEMGKLVLEDVELRDIALPYMEELRDRLKEDVQLIIPDGDEAIYIEKIISPHPVRLYTRVGRRAPLYGGACPRAILTFMPDNEIERILNTKNLKRITHSTIVDKETLLEMIKEDRKRGYTVSYGELEPGTVAIGAPIFDEDGKVIASVSIAGPEERFKNEKFTELTQGIVETADRISRVLGYNKKR